MALNKWITKGNSSSKKVLGSTTTARRRLSLTLLLTVHWSSPRLSSMSIQTEPARSRSIQFNWSTMSCRISINKLSLQPLLLVDIQTNNNFLTYWITEPYNSNLFYNNLLICILQQCWLIPYYILSYYISPSPWKIVPVFETKSITRKQHWTWKNYPKVPPE